MAVFHFSLQQILDYRDQLKDQAQVAFAKAQTELQREQSRAQEIQTQLNEQEQQLRTTPLNATGDRWLLELFIKGLQEDLSVTQLRVRALTQVVNEAKKILVQRAKDHKILEKLKEKQRERHVFNERLQEQRNYDETAALHFKPSSF